MMEGRKMTREEISDIFNEVKKLHNAVAALPHRDALGAIAAINAIADIIGEHLPGGFYGRCISCEEIKGNDEMVSCGDENLCTDCVAMAKAQ